MLRLRFAELSLLAVGLLAVAACDGGDPPAHLRIAGGDADRGRELIRFYGCGACHRVEGIQGARGVVGPPLLDYAQRKMLAGRMPNVPRNLVAWLIDPPALAPQTGMPNLGITEAQARDIATYLYTLGADGARPYPPEALPYTGPRGIVGEARPASVPAN